MSKYTKELVTGFADGAAWNKFLSELAEDAVMFGTSPHRRPDATNECDTADATNQATAIALANALKADYNAHRVLTSSHFVADSTNGVDSSDASGVATLVTLANEIKADFNAHLEDTGHVADDEANEITAADAAGEDDAAKVASAVVLLNEAKQKFNAHIAAAWGVPKTTV